MTTVFPGFISGAGMFADTGMKLPPGIGTRSPEQVAAAVVRGIEDDRSEIVVAPFLTRSTAWAGRHLSVGRGGGVARLRLAQGRGRARRQAAQQALAGRPS